ncbi:MAG: glycosyltransferase family 2 protein [Alphaproteobacteria bacterium]|nr:glycosyltransferase family 2 protein [Alphaproteobacteria bacterium]
MHMPTVSIVLPCYNGARFLATSLDSILAQTFSDWELIIVNDCSSDPSPQIATEYADRDARIRVIHNTKNLKLPGSLNVGFDMARGRYLTWTSDDNIAKDNWLATLVEYLNAHPETDMVCADMDLIDEDANVYGVLSDECARTVTELAYKSNVGAAFMYRKSAADRVGKYDDVMFCAEDYDYWVRIALSGRLDYIPDNIYLYRQNPASLTATQQPRIWAKTAAIKTKYHTRWRDRLNLGWWDRQKLAYLCRNPYPRAEFSLVGIRHILGRQLVGLVFFWNAKLRRHIKSKLEIKLQ